VAIILPAAGLVLAGCLAGALCLTSTLAWGRQRGLGAREAELRGELSADVVELLRGAADLVAFGRDEEYLDRALADDEALARLARRRSWTAGAVSGLAIAFTGIAVLGLLAVAIPASGAHRLPRYMLAVLPLVTLGAFEIVPPVADAGVEALAPPGCRAPRACDRRAADAGRRSLDPLPSLRKPTSS